MHRRLIVVGLTADREGGGWGEAARETMSAIRGRGADGGVSPASKRKLGGRGGGNGLILVEAWSGWI